ncbi:type I polyketide synthase [Nonomuraea rubra]|uniref:Acyl transferase domain-containing protein/thioesterase domain-containing protein/acyl carrier protein n=1 Tax=Nonomuraea rubra TaxID=46180 RepID=A0A7X0TVR5_9ACTN|nr:type I polyketide synthase [Nonomuraea rubra]MBB6545641.1 acyl transferase domain-containing protein/thioesterase domain-containing protein/acyl carrier protein [Nonomuraea rubra]
MDVPGEGEIRRFLVARLGDDVDPDRPLGEYGLSSRESVAVAAELGELLGRELSPTLLWEHPTVNRLARALSAPAVPVRAAPPAGVPVAVVGVGCRFPGAHGPRAYWELLIEGRDAVGEVPAGRWEAFGTATARASRYGGFLADVAGFDAEFFGIAPGEAAAMDPQQRLLLETAWEALEHGGIAPGSLAGTRTGVWTGISGNEYAYLTTADLAAVDAWTATGAALGMGANRLSYLLDLRGPSMAVDTACSSSLVATHLAVSSLRAGECDLALAAGVNLLLSPVITLAFDRGGGTAPDGRCKAFDASADGMVRAEGCGVVVLKRLPDAVRDGDRVLALIGATAVNQDGRSNGLVAPNPEAQEALLRQVYADRGPDYLEAHGTGTFLGDPIEARAIAAAIRTPVLLGSAKTNLGHLEAAAGIAGLIKTVLALHHGVIPPSLHFHRPNPHIPWDTLKVVTSPTPWPRADARAGVSAFGFGGTNAHVTLDAYGVRADAAPLGSTAKHVFLFTDTTEARVRDHARVMAAWRPDAGLRDVAHTLARRAGRGRVAAAVVAGDAAELAERLRDLRPAQATGPGPGRVATAGPGAGTGRVATAGPTHPTGAGPVWVFGGYRPHPPDLGLYDVEPAYRRTVDAVAPLLAAEAGIDVHDPLPSGVAQIQPILFTAQLALAETWRAYGFEPAAVIGHSMGEVAAAVVAGGLPLRDAVKVICTRARLLGGLDGGGAMAVVGVGAGEVPADLHVAVYAAPGQCVVTGEPERVAAFAESVAARGLFARTLTAEGAGHSPQVKPLLPVLRVELAGVAGGKPLVPYYSVVFEDPREVPVFEGAYWAAGVRRPVRLMQAVRAAVEDGWSLFTELSPHPVLTGALRDTLPPTAVLTTGDLYTQLATAATAVPPRTSGRVVDVPHSPWHHVRHWAGPLPRPNFLDGKLVTRDWAPAPPREAGSSRAWLILADEGDARAARLHSLLGPTSTLLHVEPGTTLLPGGLGPAASVLVLPSRGLDPAGARQVILRVAALAARGCRVAIGTERAQAIAEGDRPDPGAAALRGLIRVLALERPELRATLVDFDDLADLATELTSTEDPGAGGGVADDEVAWRGGVASRAGGDADDEVAWRGGVRYAARLRRVPAPPAGEAGAVVGPGAYLITGGTGRLGRLVAGRLVERGATRVVLNGRSEAAADGVVQVVAGDLALPGTAERLVAAATAGGMRLRGVIHAAGVLDDRLIADLDPGSLERVWAAKVVGGSRLHDATRSLDLDWWVAFSSAAGMLGSPGQAAYAAANAWLDGLCELRRADGLSGVAIAWGPWAGTSAGAGLPAVEPLTAEEGLEALESLIGAGVSAGVVKVDVSQAVTIFPAISRIPYFADVTREPATTRPHGPSAAAADSFGRPTAHAGLAMAHAGLPGAHAGLATVQAGLPAALAGSAGPVDLTTLTPEDVFVRVQERVAAVLGMPADGPGAGAVLTDLGLDSLAATRLRGTIEHDFGVTVPTAPMLTGTTVGTLAGMVASELGLAMAAPAVAARDAAERQVVRVLAALLGREPSVTDPIPPDVLAEAFTVLSRELGRPVPPPSMGEAGGSGEAGLGEVSRLGGLSVAELAEVVRGVEEVEAGRGVVRRLNAVAAGRPLFLAHPAGGTTGVYALLAAHLPTTPVHGLERLDTTLGIPERAERYAEAIKASGPGPYRLGGWSFGGILAFEIASRLGEPDVELVAMIDSGLPEQVPEAARREIEARRYADFAAHLRRTYGVPIELDPAELLDLPEDARTALVRARMAESGAMDALPGAVLRHQLTSHEDTRAIERYRPATPFHGRVVLYRSTEPTPWTVRDPRYAHEGDPARGFGPYCTDLEIVEIPGAHHLDLLDPPHVEVIAEHLGGLL